MKLLLLGVIVAPIFGAAQSSTDLTSALIAYGVAAPFAILCYDQLRRTRQELADERAENRRLQDASVARERELAGALASRLYDASLLYREGTAKLSEGLQRTEAPEIQALIEQMQTLVSRMEGR